MTDIEWCPVSSPHGSHHGWPASGWCPGVRAVPKYSATATVARVSPNPKRNLSDVDRRRVVEAKLRYDAAYAEYRAAVLDAQANGAGFRPINELTGLSTNTIARWKKADGRGSIS